MPFLWAPVLKRLFPNRSKASKKAHVCTSTDILTGKVQLAGKVTVIGSGMTGVETAELLETQDNEVFVVEMADRIVTMPAGRASATFRPPDKIWYDLYAGSP